MCDDRCWESRQGVDKGYFGGVREKDVQYVNVCEAPSPRGFEGIHNQEVFNLGALKSFSGSGPYFV